MNVSSCVYDVLVITESWLCSSISNGELCLNNYNLFRTDRDVELTAKYRSGGVLITVKKDLDSYVALRGQSVESMFVHFEI